MLKIHLLVTDKYQWALKPNLYLLKKYWPEHPPIVISGFTLEPNDLPKGVEFVHLGRQEEYPADRWTDGFHKMLDVSVDDDIFIFWLEDYWLVRQVDHQAIKTLEAYMRKVHEVIRCDLTDDRQKEPRTEFLYHLGHLDLVRSLPGAPYTMSFQSAIWRTQWLKSHLPHGWSPWQAEIQGSVPMSVGTLQCPCKYLIGIQKGQPIVYGTGYQQPDHGLCEEDQKMVLSLIRGHT